MKFTKNIDLEGTANTRDLGGLKTCDGHKVKSSKLIRTDCLAFITERDKEYLVAHYPHSLIIDLRRAEEIKARPDKLVPGFTYHNFPVIDRLDLLGVEHAHAKFNVVDPEFERDISVLFTVSAEGDSRSGIEKIYRQYVKVEENQKSYALLLNDLLTAENNTVFLHCADGKDRTGVGIALFLLILQVGKDEIFFDYLESTKNNEGKKDRVRTALLETEIGENSALVESIATLAGVQLNWLQAALDEITQNFAGLNNYLEKYLDFGPQKIKLLRERYLEN